MSQPTPYDRLVNFVSYALAHTAQPYNASDHDAEFNAIETTIDGILANLILIQRDDGMLKNASVHPDALSAATLLLIESAGSATGLSALLKGKWVTATAYAKAEMVQNGSFSYVCAVAHTSGTFATDYAAGKWIVLGSDAATNAAGISFSPTGNIGSTNVQAALQELDTEKAAIGGNASNQFLVSDASGATQAVSMGQIQKNNLVTAAGGGTADAMTAAIVSGLTALVDGMTFIIEAPGANTLANPTFNLTLGSTATGAKTIVKGNNFPLVSNDIASNKCHFCYDSSLDKWILLNPIYPVSTIPIANGGTGASTAAAAFSSIKQDATTTTTGVVELATNAEAQAGVDTVRGVTPANLGATVLGMGQTYQDVTASRASGVTYTNSTGRTIAVSMWNTSASAGTQNAAAAVNGVTVANNITTPGAAGATNVVFFTVPPGATYSITFNSTLTKWFELR